MLYMYKVVVRLKGGERVEYKDVLSVEFPYGDDEFDTMEVQAYDAQCFSARSNNGVLVAMGAASNVLTLIPQKTHRQLMGA